VSRFARNRPVRRRPGSRLVAVALVLLALVAAGPATLGQANPTRPPALEGVGIDEHLEQTIPLDLPFVDENGKQVTLGQYFESDRPVLIALVYYDCPMLCTVVLDRLVSTLKQMDWVAGDQFQIVTVSIDPSETPMLAKAKKQTYLREYGRAEAATGWHFLTGAAPQISALADALGFKYKYLPERGQFAHPACLFVVTPEGKISRYLYGVSYAPETMRLALVEASEGKIGSAVDQFLLYCYAYDAEEGTYGPAALKIMRVAGIVAALVLGAVLLTFWRRESGGEGSS